MSLALIGASSRHSASGGSANPSGISRSTARSQPRAAEAEPSCSSVRRSAAGRDLVHRRLAAWTWDDKLGLAREHTRWPERWARSCRYLRWLTWQVWALRADAHWRLWARLQVDGQAAIRFAWPASSRDKALSVAWCESHYDRFASNGQYLGIFQMGSVARSLYGHSRSALEQVRAALHYFRDAGGWSPWSCA